MYFTCKIPQHEKKDMKQSKSSRKLQGRLKRFLLLGWLLCPTSSYLSPRHVGINFMPSPESRARALSSASHLHKAQSSVWSLGEREACKQAMSSLSAKCSGGNGAWVGSRSQSEVGQPKKQGSALWQTAPAHEVLRNNCEFGMANPWRVLQGG